MSDLGVVSIRANSLVGYSQRLQTFYVIINLCTNSLIGPLLPDINRSHCIEPNF